MYKDEDEWRERVQYHSKKVADMGNMKDEDINAFLGVHNGAHKHIEGACPEVMAAFPKSNGFQMDFTLRMCFNYCRCTISRTTLFKRKHKQYCDGISTNDYPMDRKL